MSTKLQWVPLEANPDVMNTWAKKCGAVNTDYEIRDIYALDPQLLAVVPQPVKAVILLFPWTAEYRARAEANIARIAEDGQYPIHPDVVWIQQTIGNACGTMALLHAFANAGLPFAPDSPIDRFLGQCRGKTGTERAALLEASQDIAAIHKETADMGQTAPPSPYIRDTPHYTCFVQAPSDEPGVFRLVELDGHKGGPIDRGVCINLLEDAARVIQEEYMAKERGNLRDYAVLALAPVLQE